MAHKITKMVYDGEVSRIVRDQYVNDFRENMVQVGEEKTCLPGEYAKYAESLNTFQVRDSDVIIASYPKSGTTWTQEMVWMIANNVDFKGAEVNLEIRCPYLEFCMISDWEKIENTLNAKIPDFIKKSVEFVTQLESPRFIKTHFPFCILPEQIRDGSKLPKIIYVTRNPKDVCVSFYHHTKLLQISKIQFVDFVKIFLSDKAFYGSYWKHLLGYWNQRDIPNLLIIKFEDMKRDLPSVIRKVSNFLNKPLTEDQVQMLIEHLSFESMKNNKAVNFEDIINMRRKFNLAAPEGSFIRSGAVGKHKEEMSPEINDTFNEWIKQNIRGTDLEKNFNFDQ